MEKTKIRKYSEWALWKNRFIPLMKQTGTRVVNVLSALPRLQISFLHTTLSAFFVQFQVSLIRT